jgi:hypothetical protein
MTSANIIFMDGFDSYLNGSDQSFGVISRWVNTGTASNVATNTGRLTGKSIRLNQGVSTASDITSPPWSSSVSSFTFSSAVRWNYGSVNGVQASIMFMAGATFQIGLQFNTNGSIDVYRYTSLTAGTLLGTSDPAILGNNVWHWMDVEVVISDTVGRVSIWIDNIKAYELTNVDTNNSGGVVDRVRFPAAGGNFSSIRDFDDMFVVDTATRIGERRIEYIVPDSDVSTAWARNTGSSNFSAIDEIGGNGDTDYIIGTTVGQTDTYSFTNLTSTPDVVEAIRLVSYAVKTDAAAKPIALQVKGSLGTDSDGPNYQLLTSYSPQSRLVQKDPDTTADWTASAITGLQAGPKVTG